jgi:Heavy metal associated domain 2
MNKTTKKSKPITEGKVVHRLPGRIRVRIDRLHDDISYANDLKQAVNALVGVTEVRVNSLASSIVITYQTSELSEHCVLNCLGVVPLPLDLDRTRPQLQIL